MKREGWTIFDIWTLLNDRNVAAFKESQRVYAKGLREGYFWLFRDWQLLVIGVLLGALAYWWKHNDGLLAAMAIMSGVLGNRFGHAKGFEQGFEEGSQFGVRRVFEISETDIEELRRLMRS